MVKQPQVGRAKTRLANQVGQTEALRFYRGTTNALINRLAGTNRWRTVLAVSPDTAVSSRMWSHHLPRIAQGQGNLGERMRRPFENLPPGPVVLVGSDIPAIRQHHIWRTFKQLGDDDAVFGPATDGGYWLVGMARRKKSDRIFEGVRWSTGFALQDTIASLRGYKTSLIDELSDVDTAEDLARASPWFARRVLPV